MVGRLPPRLRTFIWRTINGKWCDKLAGIRASRHQVNARDTFSGSDGDSIAPCVADATKTGDAGAAWLSRQNARWTRLWQALSRCCDLWPKVTSCYKLLQPWRALSISRQFQAPSRPSRPTRSPRQNLWQSLSHTMARPADLSELPPENHPGKHLEKHLEPLYCSQISSFGNSLWQCMLAFIVTRFAQDAMVFRLGVSASFGLPSLASVRQPSEHVEHAEPGHVEICRKMSTCDRQTAQFFTQHAVTP